MILRYFLRYNVAYMFEFFPTEVLFKSYCFKKFNKKSTSKWGEIRSLQKKDPEELQIR